MNYESKSKEELINAILEMQKDNSSLKALFEIESTEYKQTIERLKASEQKFRSLYENMAEGAVLHEIVYNDHTIAVDYVIIEANSAFEKQLGISRHEVIGKTSKEAYKVTDPPYFDIYLRVAETGIPEFLETYFSPMEKYFSISVYSPYKGSFATIFEDITERKQSERIITMLKKSIDIMPDSAYWLDIDFNFVYINESGSKSLGYTTEELVGKSLMKVNSKVTPKLIDELREKLKTDGYYKNESIHRRKDGSEIPVEISTIYVKYADQEFFCGFATNITERKIADDQVRKLSQAVEQSPVSIVITNLEGNIIYANPKATQTTGYSLDELLGKNPRVLKSGDTPYEVYKELWDLITHFHTWRGIFHNKKKTGDLYWEASLITPIIDKQGQITNYLAVKEDITEQKQTEELLRVSEEKYRTIVNNIGEGIAFLDPDEQFVFVNHAAERIFGVDSGKLEGMNLNDFISPDQARLIQNQTLKRSLGEKSVYELTISPLNSENRIIVVTAVPCLDQEKGFLGTYGVFRDITEQKEAEEEIKLVNEQLEKLNVEKDKFFSIIAHDLRSPFNGFLGLTEVMANEIHQMSQEEIKDMSLMLNKSANTLYELLGNLLEWSRIQRGLVTISSETFLLLPKISENLKLIIESAKNKEIQFDLDIPEDLKVFNDANIIGCVIRNLANNAVKFTPQGGLIHVSAKSTNNHLVEISIKDSGIGMNQQMIDNLFRLNVNTSRKGTEGEASTGMGLIICKDLISKLGGELRIESKEGKGSIFQFTIHK